MQIGHHTRRPPEYLHAIEILRERPRDPGFDERFDGVEHHRAVGQRLQPLGAGIGQREQARPLAAAQN